MRFVWGAEERMIFLFSSRGLAGSLKEVEKNFGRR
jgi:hypothetical protein